MAWPPWVLHSPHVVRCSARGGLSVAGPPTSCSKSTCFNSQGIVGLRPTGRASTSSGQCLMDRTCVRLSSWSLRRQPARIAAVTSRGRSRSAFFSSAEEASGRQRSRAEQWMDYGRSTGWCRRGRAHARLVAAVTADDEPSAPALLLVLCCVICL